MVDHMVEQQYYGAKSQDKKSTNQEKSIIGLVECLNSTSVNFVNIHMTSPLL